MISGFFSLIITFLCPRASFFVAKTAKIKAAPARFLTVHVTPCHSRHNTRQRKIHSWLLSIKHTDPLVTQSSHVHNLEKINWYYMQSLHHHHDHQWPRFLKRMRGVISSHNPNYECFWRNQPSVHPASTSTSCIVGGITLPTPFLTQSEIGTCILHHCVSEVYIHIINANMNIYSRKNMAVLPQGLKFFPWQPCLACLPATCGGVKAAALQRDTRWATQDTVTHYASGAPRPPGLTLPAIKKKKT